MAEDDVICVCTECHSDVPDSYVERNPFAAMGAAIPCPFCGGVATIMDRSDREQALKEVDRQRGL